MRELQIMKELASHEPHLKHTVQILDDFDLRSMTTNLMRMTPTFSYKLNRNPARLCYFGQFNAISTRQNLAKRFKENHQHMIKDVQAGDERYRSHAEPRPRSMTYPH